MSFLLPRPAAGRILQPPSIDESSRFASRLHSAFWFGQDAAPREVRAGYLVPLSGSGTSELEPSELGYQQAWLDSATASNNAQWRSGEHDLVPIVGPLTVATWAAIHPSHGSSDAWVVCWGESDPAAAPNGAFLLGQQNSAGWGISVYGGAGFGVASSVNNRLQRVVATWDGGTGISLYVDGSLAGTASQSPSLSAANVSFGRLPGNATWGTYRGGILSVEFYRGAWGAGDVAADYARPLSMYRRARRYWSFPAALLDTSPATIEDTDTANGGSLSGNATLMTYTCPAGLSHLLFVFATQDGQGQYVDNVTYDLDGGGDTTLPILTGSEQQGSRTTFSVGYLENPTAGTYTIKGEADSGKVLDWMAVAIGIEGGLVTETPGEGLEDFTYTTADAGATGFDSYAFSVASTGDHRLIIGGVVVNAESSGLQVMFGDAVAEAAQGGTRLNVIAKRVIPAQARKFAWISGDGSFNYPSAFGLAVAPAVGGGGTTTVTLTPANVGVAGPSVTVNDQENIELTPGSAPATGVDVTVLGTDVVLLSPAGGLGVRGLVVSPIETGLLGDGAEYIHRRRRRRRGR